MCCGIDMCQYMCVHAYEHTHIKFKAEPYTRLQGLKIGTKKHSIVWANANVSIMAVITTRLFDRSHKLYPKRKFITLLGKSCLRRYKMTASQPFGCEEVLITHKNIKFNSQAQCHPPLTPERRSRGRDLSELRPASSKKTRVTTANENLSQKNKQPERATKHTVLYTLINLE